MPTLWEIEAEWLRLLREMRYNGIKIDRPFCLPKVVIGEEVCEGIKEDLGWNPGSPQQIGKFLLEEMKYPVVRLTEKGNPSFDKYAMEEYEFLLQHDGSDVAEKIIRYRGWQKTTSSNYKSYLKLADKHDIIHPNYKPHGTVTCRISCEDPNLQQLPKESPKEWNGDLKKAFIPRPVEHYINLCIRYGWPEGDLSEGLCHIEFDKAQLETRLAAAAAKEPDLIEAFQEDIDVFQVMADKLGWPRDRAKLFNYMTMYGAGVKKIALVFKVTDDVAKDMRDEFFGSFPRLRQQARKAADIARAKKHITYWSGRRRHLRSDYRKAWNAFLQGGAFEIVKRSGLRLRERIQYPMVLTVHDSYLLEMPRAEATEENLMYIKSILEDVPESKAWGVPFKVDYKEWGRV